MRNVTLLSSFHISLGRCNSGELYKIIEALQPDVIFEELPEDIFHRIYHGGYNPRSNEAITIKKYLEKYPTQHFPVDTSKRNEFDFFNEFDLISKRSAQYTELCVQQKLKIEQSGYSFLNSNSSIELLEKINELEERVLLEISNPRLLRQYRLDRETHEQREIEMLQSIYNYSKMYKYNNALFICGAEHRKPIMQKIKTFEEREELKLNWIFYS